jgi:hypothetical protein
MASMEAPMIPLVLASQLGEVVGSTLGVIALGLVIWSFVWVWGDAVARGKSGYLVTLFVLLAWPISLIVWLLFRPELKCSKRILH